MWVGKACIYGGLIESEPVQLKCLQANVWSHKAVPLGLLHSSTRLLMTAVCLPWRQGPSARHWHMPGNSNWGKAVCVCEACHQDQHSVGIWGYVGEKKTPGWLQMPPLKIPRPYSFQANLLTYLLSWPLWPAARIGYASAFYNLGMPQESGEAEMLGKSTEGQHWVRLTSRPQRSNMSHLSWPLVQVF